MKSSSPHWLRRGLFARLVVGQVKVLEPREPREARHGRDVVVRAREEAEAEHEIEVLDQGNPVVLQSQLREVVAHLEAVDARDAAPAQVQPLER